MALHPLESLLHSKFKCHRRNFQLCNTNLQKVNFFANVTAIKYEEDTNSCRKHDQRARMTREDGNKNFREKNYLQALEKYTASIGLAENTSTLALAYSNRSVILQKLGLHKECLVDINRALENNYPVEFQSKLLSRKRESESILKQQNKDSEKLKPEKTATCTKISKNSTYGRYVVANRDIEIGEILLTERPFSGILLKDEFLYCQECLELCYNPIPCEGCSRTFYCSPKCKDEAFNIFHKYDCLVLSFLNPLGALKDELALALRITLKLIYLGQDEIEKIRLLETHADKLFLKILYLQSWSTFFIYNILKTKTSLFGDLPDCDDTFSDLFLTVLQVMNVNLVSINRLEPTLARYDSIRYGCGLYPKYSLFNHSCLPNAFFYHDGATVIVRALASIKQGQQIFISYGQTYSSAPKLERQKEMQEKFFFTCLCRACEENWKIDEENDEYFKPFACVQIAILQRDYELLQNLLTTFIRNLKKVEHCGNFSGLSSLRQLVVDCYQIYSNPRKDVFEFDINKAFD